MKPKTIKILYWTLTILFCGFMLLSAIGGMTQKNDGNNNLGYPAYFAIMLGIGKICGVIALLQTKFKTLKEWAFAGFTIDFISAFWSMAVSGTPKSILLAPVIAMAIMFSCYFLWKKMEGLKQ